MRLRVTGSVRPPGPGEGKGAREPGKVPGRKSVRQRVPDPRGCKHEPKSLFVPSFLRAPFFLFGGRKEPENRELIFNSPSRSLKKEGRINSYVASGGVHSPPPTRRGLLSVTDAPSPHRKKPREEEMKVFVEMKKTKNRRASKIERA